MATSIAAPGFLVLSSRHRYLQAWCVCLLLSRLFLGVRPNTADTVHTTGTIRTIIMITTAMTTLARTGTTTNTPPVHLQHLRTILIPTAVTTAPHTLHTTAPRTTTICTTTMHTMHTITILHTRTPRLARELPLFSKSCQSLCRCVWSSSPRDWRG